jgi:hypothetical protein
MNTKIKKLLRKHTHTSKQKMVLILVSKSNITSRPYQVVIAIRPLLPQLTPDW